MNNFDSNDDIAQKSLIFFFISLKNDDIGNEVHNGGKKSRKLC